MTRIDSSGLIQNGAGFTGVTGSVVEPQVAKESGSVDASREMGPDTVNISDKARALLDAKMKEYHAQSPGDLTPEEHEDLKKTMATADGVTDQDRATLASLADRKGRPGGGKGLDGPPPGAQGMKKGPPPKKGGDSGRNADEITTKDREISDVKEEIEALQAKAATSEESKDALKSKRIALSVLEDELTLLKKTGVAG